MQGTQNKSNQCEGREKNTLVLKRILILLLDLSLFDAYMFIWLGAANSKNLKR